MVKDTLKHATTSPYPCKALDQHGGATRAYASGANGWRQHEARAAWREMNASHVWLVPLHATTRGLWDAHVGYGRFMGKGMDCTHLCNGRFVWEPLWWALALAVGD